MWQTTDLEMLHPMLLHWIFNVMYCHFDVDVVVDSVPNYEESLTGHSTLLYVSTSHYSATL